MPVEENIQLMKRWFQEVWNEGKIETIHELLATDAIGKGQAGADSVIHGPKDFVPFVEQIRGTFPDVRIVIEDAFGADDRVVLRWSAKMTHRGEGLGVPASNKEVRLTGITIARIRNGQIVEGWDNWDQLGMMAQIGAYSPPKTMTLPRSA